MHRRRREGRFPGNLGCCGFCAVSTIALCLISVVFCAGVLLIIEDSAPQPLIADFTPSQFQADAFDSRIATAAAEAAAAQRFYFSTTEQEASSWLNLNAPKYTGGAIAAENIQVEFGDNYIQVYSEVDAPGFSNVPTLLEVEIERTEAGELAIDIRDANVGGFGLPDFMMDELRQTVQDAIDDQLERISGKYVVTGLFFDKDNGTLAIQGNVVP